MGILALIFISSLTKGRTTLALTSTSIFKVIRALLIPYSSTSVLNPEETSPIKDILTGTQVQRCSSYFNEFTTTRMYLLKTDVEILYFLQISFLPLIKTEISAENGDFRIKIITN